MYSFKQYHQSFYSYSRYLFCLDSVMEEVCTKISVSLSEHLGDVSNVSISEGSIVINESGDVYLRTYVKSNYQKEGRTTYNYAARIVVEKYLRETSNSNSNSPFRIDFYPFGFLGAFKREVTVALTHGEHASIGPVHIFKDCKKEIDFMWSKFSKFIDSREEIKRRHFFNVQKFYTDRGYEKLKKLTTSFTNVLCITERIK